MEQANSSQPPSASSSSNLEPRSDAPNATHEQQQQENGQEQSPSDAYHASTSDVAAEQTPPASSIPSSSSPTAQPRAGSADHSQQHSNDNATASAASSSEPVPTLWENFMASLRNVVHRNPTHPSNDVQPQSHPDQPQVPRSAPAPASQQAQNQNESTNRSDTGVETDASGLPRPPLYFRLPFNGPDGNPALLAFHPQPLPNRDSQSTNAQSQSDTPARPPTSSASSDPQTSPASGTSSSPSDRPGANAAAGTHSTPTPPNAHPHPAGHVPVSPLYVPFGASPLPFSFIYDATTQTAWPIAQVTPGSPPGGPSPDAPQSHQPRLVAGPPFRIILDIHFAPAPEPEQPDPQKAANYVKQLERADAELRSRMARLGIGSIGGFATASGSDDQDTLLGCGVCLDSYEAEDRPEWIDGPRSHDEAVVAVPCTGHHTLHAGCLRDWLSKLPPSQWTCPFCRASLSAGPDTTQSPPSHAAARKSTSATTPPVHTSLRDEVRARERQRGWRCDAPACLPRYPNESRVDDAHLELPQTSDDMTTDLVKLSPCRHEVHLDCLCTSMRIENPNCTSDHLDLFVSDDDDDDEEGEDDSQDAAALQQVEPSLADPNPGQHKDTVGKWVSCPTCRKEVWAQLPLRRKPHRPRAGIESQLIATADKTASATSSMHEPHESTYPNDHSGVSVDHVEEFAVDAMLHPST